jgi:hypothetical protein
MTPPPREFAELRELLHALCEESITAEQVRRLEELVLAHPEAEAYYVQYMSLHADLVGRYSAPPVRAGQSLRDRVGAAASGPGTAAAETGGGKGRSRRRRLFGWGLGLTGLAAAVLFAVVFEPWSATGPGPAPQASEASDDTVAVLLQASGAEWGDGELPTRAGAPLRPGWLRLKKGFAQVEFYSGAIVILEGPAELKLISRTEAYCARGKLRATVPPQSRGFTVGSPKLDLVDRGTEFGLDVGAGGRTEVHVFEGKVELYDPQSGREPPSRKELTTGQGVRLEEAGRLSPIRLDPAGFLTARELAARSEEDLRQRRQAWRAASEALRKDPSLLVYYTFEADQPWARTLQDRASARREPHDGAIVGCAWAEGRWPGKKGLEFKRVSDRVRLHVPGEYESVTLAAWVRVDGLPNLNNSLLMADGWPVGGLHWQIGNSGTLILGVQAQRKVRAAHYHAPGAMTPERFGRWVHLAVTYDRAAGVVTHYLDGQSAAAVPIEFDIPLRIGRAELGNWNIATHRNSSPIRFFSGCMDEFLLFSRALSGEEVERLHAQGRPPF